MDGGSVLAIQANGTNLVANISSTIANYAQNGAGYVNGVWQSVISEGNYNNGGGVTTADFTLRSTNGNATSQINLIGNAQSAINLTASGATAGQKEVAIGNGGNRFFLYDFTGDTNNSPGNYVVLVTNTAPSGSLTILANGVANAPYGVSSTNFLGNGSSLTNIPASALTGFRAGITNLASLSTSQVVIFSTPMPTSVGTNYTVWLTFGTTLAGATSAAVTAETTNGFTITLSAGITGTEGVQYGTQPFQ